MNDHLKTVKEMGERRQAHYAQLEVQRREAERAAGHAVIEEAQKKDVRLANWRCCLNCSFWTEVPMSGKTMICGKWKTTPPPDVIVHGCKDWEDEIPF